jgi:thiamine biosynthesis lipoprotein
VGPVLAEALHVAIDAAERTRGVVDPTVGAVTLSEATASPTVTRAGTYRDVVVTDVVDGAVVEMPRGVRLDLGATAKAWAADRAAALAAAASGLGVLVSLSGDIAIAGAVPADGWTVLVTDDHREGAGSTSSAAQTISLSGGGLATSSTTVRNRPTADGSTVAHVIDPITWRPVTPVWRTVSVAAGDCVTANTASTAALVLGDRAVAWLEATSLPCRLVGTDGTVVSIGAWPAAEREGVPA